ncbi:hypothetical protein AAC387_Pa06g1715 [Persea americana]
MIDDLQQLGIDYHFLVEIESILCGLCENHGALSILYDVALSFRLLGEHGHYVSQDVFKRFMDEKGRFRLQLSTNIKGMMSLYEASKLAIEGEDIIGEANDFATKNLIASVKLMEPCLARVVRHSLENPFHMSLPSSTPRTISTVYGKLVGIRKPYRNW